MKNRPTIFGVSISKKLTVVLVGMAAPVIASKLGLPPEQVTGWLNDTVALAIAYVLAQGAVDSAAAIKAPDAEQIVPPPIDFEEDKIPVAYPVHRIIRRQTGSN